MTRYTAWRFVLVLVLGTLDAGSALAQGIAGTVRNPAGQPAAGVAVEVTSPVLIERARTSVTDATGRYQILDLRPGTYTIRFTFPGWHTYVIERVELHGSLTARVNAAMQVAPVDLAVTVSGRVPVVDARSVGRELSLDGDDVRNLPTARSYNALLPLVPGVVTSANDVVTGTSTVAFPIDGGRANDGRLAIDGFTVGSPPSGNSATSYVLDVGRAADVTFTVSGAGGDAETSGLVMNVVSQAGGDVIRGSFLASGSADAFHASNVTPELRAQGAIVTDPFSNLYDLAGTFGGPVVRGRLWYYVNGHRGGSQTESTTVFFNRNAGDSAQWLYVPDPMRPSYSDRTFENASARLTWQLAPGQKLSAFWDAQALCRTCTGATPGLSEPQRISPEAVGVLGRRLDVLQATWSAPLTSRLLLDAGFGGTYFGVGNFERQPNPTRGLIRVMEQCASGCPGNGGIPGLVYRSQDFSDAHAGSSLWKASMTYVAGRHTWKAGYQQSLMTDDRTWFTNDQGLTYRFNNGVPNQLTQSISPWVNDARVGWMAVWVQHQATLDRLTIQGAVRFDRASSWFPRQQLGPSPFLPDPIVVPESRGVDSYKDVSVRMGGAYDLSGTGRTILRASLGKYLEGAGSSGAYANSNPTLRLPQTTSAFGPAGVTRAWTDANRNYVADCDLRNPAAQDRRAAGGDVCGAMSNVRFGEYVLSNTFDPRLLDGWGVRPSDWNLSASWQQQIASRSWIEVTYTRHWFANFAVVDNRALAPADLTPYSIVAPIDPRLPGGGGYVVDSLYDVVPEKFGQVDNLVTSASGYGAWRQHYDGLDVTLSLRTGARFTMVGGTSTGRTISDNCAVRAQLPELATTTTGTSAFGPGLATSAVTPASPYCHVVYGPLTQARGGASYTVPGIDVQLAATMQSKPGPMLAAQYAVPNAAVVPSLGRNLSGNAANVTVNLIEPGTRYGGRINQLDVRVSKRVRLGGTTTSLGLEVYNTLNSSAVLSYSPAFVPGGTWLQPQAILSPRFLKLSAELEF